MSERISDRERKRLVATANISFGLLGVGVVLAAIVLPRWLSLDATQQFAAVAVEVALLIGALICLVLVLRRRP